VHHGTRHGPAFAVAGDGGRADFSHLHHLDQLCRTQVYFLSPANGVTSGGGKSRIYGANFALRYLGADLELRFNSRGLAAPSTTLMNAYWSAALAGTAADGEVSRWISSLELVPFTPQIGAHGNQSLEFFVPAGYGVNREVFVVVDGFPSSILNFSYDKPTITNISPDRLGVASGFMRVFVEGTSFCDGMNECGIVYVSGSRVTTQNYSHTSIMFVVPLPADPVPVQIVVAGVGSNIVSFSAPVPNFQALQGQGSWDDMDTAGGESFYIAGVSDVGGAPLNALQILIGGADCLNLARTQDGDHCAALGIASDSPLAINCKTYRLTCSTPPGIGRNLPIIVGVPGGQSRADSSFLFSYGAPVITDVIEAATGMSLMAGLLSSSGVPTTGGEVILVGRNFGNASLAGGSGSATVGTSAATVIQQAHYLVRISVPPGVGTGIGVLYLVGGQSTTDISSSVPATLRYVLPSVSTVSPQRGGTAGGYPLTITGSNFGPYVYGSAAALLPIVSVGGRACVLSPTYVPTVSHNQIICIAPPGQGANLSVVVTVASQTSTSNTATYQYALPQVFSISPIRGPTSGLNTNGAPINITLHGQNLGLVSTITFVPVGIDEGLPEIPVAAESITFQNHTTIVFQMPEGTGIELQVVVQCWRPELDGYGALQLFTTHCAGLPPCRQRATGLRASH
jgi:hypothetical protein